jgi:hypothetical protein
MEDLTEEKWEELNDKLLEEFKAAKDHADSLAHRGGYLWMGVVAVVVALGVTMVLLGPSMDQIFYFVPAVVPVAVLAFFAIRAGRVHQLAVSDVERIERDIRAWKKRKPGSVFDKQRKAEAAKKAEAGG